MIATAVWAGIFLGAALGACLRFAVDRFAISKWGTALPYGTFIVNMSGTLVLGLITGATLGATDGKSASWQFANALIGTGFCGALTTFSGFASQVLELGRNPIHWRGAVYGLLSVCLGFAIATLGFVITY